MKGRGGGQGWKAEETDEMMKTKEEDRKVAEKFR